MKQNVIGVFEKNVKTYLQRNKSHLMPPLRHSHFHPILNIPVKMVALPQYHANIIVHWS